MKNQMTHTTLTPERKASIYEAFAKHAIASVGFDGLAREPVAFEIMENDISLGVVVCQLFWGNFHIKYLFTNKEHRGRGIARALMEHAFNFGKANGCHFAFVETMGFQAPEFYEKLGFEIELKRHGYKAGTSFYYLKRELNFENMFDGIWAQASLLHIPYDLTQDIYEKIHRSLKPNGIFYASYKYGDSYMENPERDFYNMNEINVMHYLNGLFSVIELWNKIENKSKVAPSPDEMWLNFIVRKI